MGPNWCMKIIFMISQYFLIFLLVANDKMLTKWKIPYVHKIKKQFTSFCYSILHLYCILKKSNIDNLEIK